MFNGHPFPVNAFPQIIRNAIYEVEQHTQAPQGLIAASALGVISLACQNRIDVCRLTNLRSPVSLYLLTLAESGERKSTVDKMLMKPLYQLEEELFDKYTHALNTWRSDEEIFNFERKALMSKLNQIFAVTKIIWRQMNNLKRCWRRTSNHRSGSSRYLMMPLLRLLKITSGLLAIYRYHV